MTNFTKYQSLGNDFIIIEQSEAPAQNWPAQVRAMCNRHFGIGADGVLVVSSAQSVPHVAIFNADGSQAELCLNGVRCVAHFLRRTHNFPATFDLAMGSRTIHCSIDQSGSITTNIGTACYHQERRLEVTFPTPQEHIKQTFIGHEVSVGNPHFVIFEETTIDWLAHHGALFERHEAFPRGTNTEFVWQRAPGTPRFNVLVYERGCGITLSCSSGAAAIVQTLKETGRIRPNEPVELHMPGGSLSCLINEKNDLLLTAQAYPIFRGSYTC